MARQKRTDDDAPEQKERPTRPIQIDRELVQMMGVICQHYELTHNEFLADHIRPFIITHYQRVQKEMESKLRDLGKR